MDHNQHCKRNKESGYLLRQALEGDRGPWISFWQAIVFASIDKLRGFSAIPRTLQTHCMRLSSMRRAASINLRVAPSSPLDSLGS